MNMLTLSNKMFNLVLIISVVSVEYGRSYEITSYSRVSKNGDSISAKSDTENHGIDPSSSYMSHVQSTLIDKQNNEALQQQQQQYEENEQEQQRATSGNENVEEVEEKSEGRAIKSNYYFPLSDFLTKAKAMQSNSYKNGKEGRLIVYPSYTQNIDQTRRRYDMTPSTGQVAQKRFAPGEAYGVTLYKLKHPEKFGGYKYPNPPNPPSPPVMMMVTPAPQLPPQMILTTSAPPQPMPMQQYLPPSKFYSPIVVAESIDTTTEGKIVTVRAIRQPSATSPSFFLPTMPPDDPDSTSMNPIIDLLSYNNKVNTSYMPPELQAIRDSIDNNHVAIDEFSSNKNNINNNNINDDVEVKAVAPADLHRFPPNINSIYPPTVMVRNNAINYKSQNSLETTTISKEDLHKFPPNIDSSYIHDSYSQPPSGYKDNNIIDDSKEKTNESVDGKVNSVEETSISAVDLNKFPPNINSIYFPPDMTKFVNLYNSYVPPASGQQKSNQLFVRQAVDLSKFPEKLAPNQNDTEEEEIPVSSNDLHRFPPNSDSAYLPPEMITLMNLYNSYIPPASGQQLNGTESSKTELKEEEESSVAPNDLHKFPPNSDSAYLPPEMIKLMNLYNSYIPPASGEPKDTASISQSEVTQEESTIAPNDLHKFPPNLDSAYLPPEMMKLMNLYNSYLPPASGTNDNDQQALTENDDSSNDMMYLPPKDLHNFPPNTNSFYLPPEMTKDLSLINSYLPPAAGDPSSVSNSQISSDLDLKPPPLVPSIAPSPSFPSMMNQQAVNGGMQMSQGYSYNKPTGGDNMMQPPAMDMMKSPMMDMPSAPMDMSGPPADDPHHHHHHHDHHPWDSYPDVYYDDHFHHHHHHEEETTTTTTTEAPSEPRVKKYSYYYLGRKLWYIPLYFTFWFCLYVAALIIRSIGRHKVDLPNHYVSRSLHDMSHQELVEKINKMTEFTMAQIDDFKNKYL